MRAVAGVGAGGFAGGRLAGLAAQEATPAGDATPVGDHSSLAYLSLRVRQLSDAALRPEINEIVVDEFVPVVQAIDGYAGYLLGDVIDDPTHSLSIVVLDTQEQGAGFDAVSQEFVAGLDPKYQPETPTAVAGDVLVLSRSSTGDGTPAATPMTDGAPVTGYVAVRIYESLPDTDPSEFAPLIADEFVPIVQVLPGFRGYLYLVTESGFVSVSLFESEEAALQSNEAGIAWAAENLSAYTPGNPQVINATIVLADLPVLEETGQ